MRRAEPLLMRFEGKCEGLQAVAGICALGAAGRQHALVNHEVGDRTGRRVYQQITHMPGRALLRRHLQAEANSRSRL